MKIRTIIIDDEPHAREGIRIRLKDFKEIEIVDECSSGYDAVEKINILLPHLIFLDIQMPGMNGFEMLKKIDRAKMPVVIFVTAYDKYALKAFEYHAVDYLLKPIDNRRFKDAVDYAISEINHRNLELYSTKLRAIANDYLKLISKPENNLADEKFVNRLSIKHKNIIKIISVSEINWIEAQGDYVFIHSNSEKYLLRDSLMALEKKLNPDVFVRIHRSSIVNIERVEKLKTSEHGDYDVYLKDGTKLKMSRTYRDKFKKLLNDNF